MAEQTLLDMTQIILSSLDSDEVNSINDTVESLQVARIVQQKYYDLVYRGDFPSQEQLFQLNASGDNTKPTLMFVPAKISRVNWIKYFDSNTADSQQVDQFGSYRHGLNTDLVSSNTWTTTSTSSVTIGTGNKTFVLASSTLPIQLGQGVLASSGTNSMFGTVVSYNSFTMVMNVTSTVGSGTFSTWTLTNAASAATAGYKYVTILPVDEFLDMVNRFNPSDNNVGSFVFTEGGYNFNFYYKNNKQPRYATFISNFYIVFDTYDNQFDTTLQGSKTLVYGQFIPDFTLTDTFVPDLDDEQFPLLINEAKISAFYELKQMGHPIADREVKRQWSAVQKNKAKANKPSYFDALADFGRVPRTGGYSSGGYGAYKWMRQAGP